MIEQNTKNKTFDNSVKYLKKKKRILFEGGFIFIMLLTMEVLL